MNCTKTLRRQGEVVLRSYMDMCERVLQDLYAIPFLDNSAAIFNVTEEFEQAIGQPGYKSYCAVFPNNVMMPFDDMGELQSISEIALGNKDFGHDRRALWICEILATKPLRRSVKKVNSEELARAQRILDDADSEECAKFDGGKVYSVDRQFRDGLLTKLLLACAVGKKVSRKMHNEVIANMMAIEKSPYCLVVRAGWLVPIHNTEGLVKELRRIP